MQVDKKENLMTRTMVQHKIEAKQVLGGALIKEGNYYA
jgi:hypothetical protein